MLKVTEEKNIVIVSLDRPDVRNSFHPEMIQKITETFVGLSARKDLRSIVLSGEGSVFCAGADLNWMKDMAKYTLEQNQQDSEKLFQMFEAIWACPVPVIGVVQGAAFGGALGLMAVCDHVIVQEKTQLCFSEVKIGLVPAVISAFILRKCTAGVMLPLMLSGRVFSGQEVLGSGLVHEVASEAHMAQALGHTISFYQEAAPEALRETKNLVRNVMSSDWSDHQKETTRVIAERRVSSEGQEGLKCFFEKKNPWWKNQAGSQ
ncbi:MAG: enoyl-CoA hydratase [Bdellovibrio sp. CG10_big_fil_rev_8_21_14_0_10_47_8]|nr:MAG: enoyl-CoA hydratase [Bdellovibrio sp. CG10_big_fil_rev_8_21_14_0_10_47_8]